MVSGVSVTHVGDLPFTFRWRCALFGSSVSSIGDFNKDKKLDIIIGSQGEVSTTNSPQKGRLNLLFPGRNRT
jgi:hypothetical protein